MVASSSSDHSSLRSACCASSPRISILDYIDRGLMRNRREPLPIIGDVQRDRSGRAAQFSLQVENDVIHALSFKVSTCVTLVAYCELLAEWVTGLTLREAATRARPAELAVAFPGVPALKRDRALLATAALQASILKALERESK